MTLATALGQLLRSIKQIAPTILHRNVLLNFSVHRKHVFQPCIIIYSSPKGQTHNLTIRGRGPTPSCTHKQLHLTTSRNWFSAFPVSQYAINTHRNMLALIWWIAYTWQERKFVTSNSKNSWEDKFLPDLSLGCHTHIYPPPPRIS